MKRRYLEGWSDKAYCRQPDTRTAWKALRAFRTTLCKTVQVKYARQRPPEQCANLACRSWMWNLLRAIDQDAYNIHSMFCITLNVDHANLPIVSLQPTLAAHTQGGYRMQLRACRPHSVALSKVKHQARLRSMWPIALLFTCTERAKLCRFCLIHIKFMSVYYVYIYKYVCIYIYTSIWFNVCTSVYSYTYVLYSCRFMHTNIIICIYNYIYMLPPPLQDLPFL